MKTPAVRVGARVVATASRTQMRTPGGPIHACMPVHAADIPYEDEDPPQLTVFISNTLPMFSPSPGSVPAWWVADCPTVDEENRKRQRSNCYTSYYRDQQFKLRRDGEGMEPLNASMSAFVLLRALCLAIILRHVVLKSSPGGCDHAQRFLQQTDGNRLLALDPLLFGRLKRRS
jgi:hypothetical protein